MLLLATGLSVLRSFHWTVKIHVFFRRKKNLSPYGFFQVIFKSFYFKTSIIFMLEILVSNDINGITYLLYLFIYDSFGSISSIIITVRLLTV